MVEKVTVMKLWLGLFCCYTKMLNAHVSDI